MTQRILRLLHISDIHLHALPDARMRGVVTEDTFRATMARAMADPDPPGAILVTGDLVQDETRAGYERLRIMLGDYGLPVYCLPGNHDAPGIMAEVLGSPPFQFCGEVHTGNWCIVLLSSFHRGDDGGLVSAGELQRLADILQREDAEHVMVCVHHQPVPMESRWLDGVGMRNADDLLAVIDTSSRIRAVVWGHVHQASDRWRHGVRLLSTPATCLQFLPKSDDFVVDDRPPGFRWLDLQSNGRIDTEVVWLDID